MNSRLVEKTLDAIATPVEFLVAGEFFAAGADRGDDRLDAVGGQARADAIGVATFVERGELDHVVGAEAFAERLKLPAVVGVAGAQVEGGRAILVERGRMELGAPAAPRAAQSLVAAVFLGAPAACGWARTVFESKSRPRAARALEMEHRFKKLPVIQIPRRTRTRMLRGLHGALQFAPHWIADDFAHGGLSHPWLQSPRSFFCT